jgi:hypothetical protein
MVMERLVRRILAFPHNPYLIMMAATTFGQGFHHSTDPDKAKLAVGSLQQKHTAQHSTTQTRTRQIARWGH